MMKKKWNSTRTQSDLIKDIANDGDDGFDDIPIDKQSKGVVI